MDWEDFLRSGVLGALGAACGANKKCSEFKHYLQHQCQLLLTSQERGVGTNEWV